MNKAYNRIDWENLPSEKTPLNEQNLNRMDGALDEIDNRVIALDKTKANLTDISMLFADASMDETTGIITFTRKNGSVLTIDTPFEKIALNIYYDPVTEKLILPLIDGTQWEVDLSRLITEYEFLDSDTIAFSVKPDGKITAIVKEGSIEEKHLRPDYLADIKIEVAKAEQSEANAEQSATSAENSKKLAESYTHGGTGIREGENEDNAKKYKELAEEVYENLQRSTVTGVKGNAETDYRQGNINLTPENIGLGNVPNVGTNNQTPTFTQAATRENIASGNKLSVIFGKIMKWYADLKAVAFSGSYNDLSDKPTVGNGTITIKQAGTSKGTFTMNQSGNTTIELTDNNTTYADMKGATASAAGTHGLAPAPAKGAQGSYLTGGATYQNVDDHAAAFTSADVADGGASAWTSVAKLDSGETHKSILNKVSSMFKNVRYLYKMLGTTNISAIGGGTVTGAISELNTGMAYEDFTDQFGTSPNININMAYTKNRMAFVMGWLRPGSAGEYKIAIPQKYRPVYNMAGNYFVSSGNDIGCVLAVYVESASSIVVWTAKANVNNISFSFLYPLN